jgi:hypothetical protein
VRDLEALLGYLAERAAMPFAWGREENDCVSHMAGAVKAQTGRNCLPEANWSSETGAARVLRRLGGIEAAMDARFARIAPAAALRGDIAGVADARFGFRLMIVEGDSLVGPGPRGHRRNPRSAMVIAWDADSFAGGRVHE